MANFDLVRPRSFSCDLSDRTYPVVFGETDFLGLHVVTKNTFLELCQPNLMSTSFSDVSSTVGSDDCCDTVSTWDSSDNEVVEVVEEVDISDDEDLVKPSCPPGRFVLQSKRAVAEQNANTDMFTTIAIRNLPINCTSGFIAALLDSEGFAGCYDFVYAPMDFQNGASLRYASVNMTCHQFAASAIAQLNGLLSVGIEEKLEVSWNLPLQGLSVHVRRYQNSPVMHPAVPDEFKPMVFLNGFRKVFPLATRKIKKPRMRQFSAATEF